RSDSARLSGPVRRDRRFPDLPHPVGRRGEEPGLERLRDRHRGRTRPVGTQPHRPQRTTGLLVRGAAAQRLGVRRLRGPGIRRHPAGAGGEAAAPIPPPILATGVRLLRDGARPARPTGPLGQLQRRAPAGDRDRAPPGGAAGRRPVVRARHVQRLGHPHPVRPAPGVQPVQLPPGQRVAGGGGHDRHRTGPVRSLVPPAPVGEGDPGDRPAVRGAPAPRGAGRTAAGLGPPPPGGVPALLLPAGVVGQHHHRAGAGAVGVPAGSRAAHRTGGSTPAGVAARPGTGRGAGRPRHVRPAGTPPGPGAGGGPHPRRPGGRGPDADAPDPVEQLPHTVGVSGAITRGPVSEFLRGIGLLGQGLRLYLQAPRVLLLGLIPVAITAALFVAAFVVLGVFLSDLAALVTWSADDWAPGYRPLVRVTAAIAVLGVARRLAVLTFTAVALAIGAPFYERISDLVERGCGDDVPDAETGFWRSFWSG